MSAVASIHSFSNETIVRPSLWARIKICRMAFLALWLSTALFGCGLLPKPDPVVLPETCHPATDLASHKEVTIHPEVATPNDEAYKLWLGDRSMWAKDVDDYNSLYSTCVK